jgi:hypothetical protein
MSSVRVFKVCLTILLSAGIVAADSSAYQKGTLNLAGGPGHKSYNLKAGLKIYQIGNCGDFQNGQEVQFIVKDDKIYIAREGAKDYKCLIEATTESADPNAPPTPNAAFVPTYLKGTILGYSVRRDLHISGGGGAPGSLPVSSNARKAKVYELQGPDLVYQVDYCGSFQAGKFETGQVVDFRVDSVGGRLYIRHDGEKEYSCQLEGTRKPDVQNEGAAQTAAASPAAGVPAAAAARSSARISVASVPDGADIEIDGSFVGNTPSDLEVPEGERSIVVKKSGYKIWERKMKVVAGSSIHLNAEMEKSPTP